jgi:hypothetical protein
LLNRSIEKFPFKADRPEVDGDPSFSDEKKRRPVARTPFKEKVW